MNIKKILENHTNWLNKTEGGEKATLRCANFRCANFRDADLRGADLIVLPLPIWTVYIHKDTARIGCKHYKHEEWLSFSDQEIAAMDNEALSWWNRHKLLIEAGIQTIKNQQQ